MSRRPIPPLLGAALLAVACSSSSSAPGPAPLPPAAAAAAPDDWARAMKQVKLHYERIETALLRPPFGDLRAVAADANAAAELLRLGYGVHEDRSVPGFARMARDAEAWLLEVALEARQAHGDIASDRFLGGRQRHCGDCHDAHERVQR